MSYASELVQLLADRGHSAEIVGTGGNCRAVEVSYGLAGHLLVTDGDADLPSYEYGVLVGNYGADGSDLGIIFEPDFTPDVTDLADVIDWWLHTGSIVDAPPFR